MAVNVSGLKDEDGDFSDWLEIHNAGLTAVSLAGWFLTDTTKNRIETQYPRLSPVFTYYRSDFGNSRSELGSYLATWFDGDTKKKLESGRFGMRELPFDWSLNATAITR